MGSGPRHEQTCSDSLGLGVQADRRADYPVARVLGRSRDVGPARLQRMTGTRLLSDLPLRLSGQAVVRDVEPQSDFNVPCVPLGRERALSTLSHLRDLGALLLRQSQARQALALPP